MSVTDIPPSLMTREQRAEEIAELERQISSEWKRFAITEAVVVWLPFIAFLAVFVATDSVTNTGRNVAVGIAGAAIVGLVVYWMVVRILPRQRRLTALRDEIS